MIGRCAVAISRGCFHERWRLVWMDFGRSSWHGTNFPGWGNGLIDPLHFLLFTLLVTGLLPLPVANCQSWLRLVGRTFTTWHLQYWSCFPVGLHHLLVACSLWTISNLQWQKAQGTLQLAFWDAASCLGDRATERKPWLGPGQFFQPRE